MSAQHKDQRTQSLIVAIENHERFSELIDVLGVIQDDAAKIASDGSLARFKQAIDAIITDNLKSAASSLKREYSPSRSTSGSSEWRQDLKDHFGGRGRQWVKLNIEDLDETLELLSAEHNTDDYKSWINKAGYAWVRYAGPRIHNNQPHAAFEVRLYGSKQDHIGIYHYVPADDAMSLEFLPNTPFGLALER